MARRNEEGRSKENKVQEDISNEISQQKQKEKSTRSSEFKYNEQPSINNTVDKASIEQHSYSAKGVIDALESTRAARSASQNQPDKGGEISSEQGAAASAAAASSNQVSTEKGAASSEKDPSAKKANQEARATTDLSSKPKKAMLAELEKERQTFKYNKEKGKSAEGASASVSEGQEQSKSTKVGYARKHDSGLGHGRG